MLQLHCSKLTGCTIWRQSAVAVELVVTSNKLCTARRDPSKQSVYGGLVSQYICTVVVQGKGQSGKLIMPHVCMNPGSDVAVAERVWHAAWSDCYATRRTVDESSRDPPECVLCRLITSADHTINKRSRESRNRCQQNEVRCAMLFFDITSPLKSISFQCQSI